MKNIAISFVLSCLSFVCFAQISTNNLAFNSSRDPIKIVESAPATGSEFEKGDFKDGSKVGIWEYYDINRKLIQKFDHSSHVLVYDRSPSKPVSFSMLGERGWVNVVSSTPPMYVGGADRMIRQLSEKLRFPDEAARKGFSGVVKVSFTINEKGKVGNYVIEEAVGGGCEEEAVRALRSIPNEWIPGRVNGKAVTSKYIIPIKFN